MRLTIGSPKIGMSGSPMARFQKSENSFLQSIAGGGAGACVFRIPRTIFSGHNYDYKRQVRGKKT